MKPERKKHFDAEWVGELASGENPYQGASLWSLHDGDGLALANFRLVSGNMPCATNLADLDSVVAAMVRLVSAWKFHYDETPYMTIAAKHGNACGIGVDRESSEGSIAKALWGNPLAVWGGEAVVNFRLGRQEAEALVSDDRRKEKCGGANWMLDVVAAPDMDDEAKATLAGRRETRVFVNGALARPGLPDQPQYRFARGALIEQDPADYLLKISDLAWSVPGPLPESAEDLFIAWAAAYSSFHGGNEVAIARDGQLLSCAGGPSTVEAAETAVARAVKAHGPLAGASFAADAFFPFTDAPSVLVKAGLVAGVVPAGGRRHDDISAFFCQNKVKVGFIPERFRGFCRH